MKFTGLTPKLREILRHMASGMTNGEIAEVTGKTKSTVRTQAALVYEVLGASNRAHAVAIGIREGLIE